MERIDRQTEFEFKIMQKFNLNAEEWMLAKLLMAKLWSNKSILLEQYYGEVVKESIAFTTISSLIAKGVLESIDLTKVKYIDQIFDSVYFTDKFNEYYSTDLFTIGDELWEAYPGYMSSQFGGKRFNAKNISKQFRDDAELYDLYHKQIRGRVDKHKDVMNILDVAKKKGYISCGIAEFVISKQWESLEELINEESYDMLMLAKFGNDLWETYPSEINGFPMKNITKFGFNSVEAFNKYYFESIGYSESTHKEVLSVLKKAISENKINFSIYEFVSTKKWKELKTSSISLSTEHAPLFKELYALYPDTMMINGEDTSLKVVTGVLYKDLNAIALDYYNAIDRDKEIHGKVLQVTKYAIEQGLINMSLAKYVKNRLWISFSNKM